MSRSSDLKFWRRSIFGIAIFTAAFLLFQVQLLLGKFLLPWFGGTSAIWATCLLFFQVLLLGGYVYAHQIASAFRPSLQGKAHLAFLAFTSFWLVVAWYLQWRLLATVLPATSGVRRFGAAALDLAYVAAGRLDGFWEFGLSPWDIAAGMLLVREAGGFVTDLAGGQKMMETGDVLAANDRLHLPLAALIKQAIRGGRPAA